MSNLLNLANQIARRPWAHAEPFRMLQEMDYLLRDPFLSPVSRDPLRTRRFARPQRPQQQQQQPQQQQSAQSDKAVQQSSQAQSNAVAESENARNQSQQLSRWNNRWLADPFFTDSVFTPSRFERDLWGRMDPFFNQMERAALPETEVTESDKAFVVTMDVPGVRKEDVKIRLGGRDNRTLTITAERREETEEAIESEPATETAQPSASTGQATASATTAEPTAASTPENKAADATSSSVQVQAADNNKVARPTRRSVSSFKFSQTLELPDNADVKGINAKCEHGQLRLTIPKVEVVPEEEQTIPIQ